MNDHFSDATIQAVASAGVWTLVRAFEERVKDLEALISSRMVFGEDYPAEDLELKTMKKIVKKLTKLEAALDELDGE